MIKFIFRKNKNYSRFNILKELCRNTKIDKEVFILMPFSKNQFFKHFFKRDSLINDFFISNYDTYVYDRKKITKKNPRAWWKYFQDWFNFRFSKYLLSDTNEHFLYWEELFGKFKGKHLVLPVLADKSIYYPSLNKKTNEKTKILFYGSFIPLHGIDVILNAFSLMEKEDIDFEAKIIGKGQIYSKMKSLYERLNLKKVQMTGEFIDENSLAEEIREADIILGIFGNSKKAKSVIPNKVYQATACKKCTVTMESKVLKEFYDENDLVVCKNNAEALSKELCYLVLNKEKIYKYSENGYLKFNKVYDETKIKFKKFIEEI